MEIDQWWPELSVRAREWLVANNGDAVPAWVMSEIAKAGGDVASHAERVGETGTDGYSLSDSTTDWIEKTANDEN